MTKPGDHDPTFEELRREARASMTPGERYLAALQEKQIEALNRQNATAADMARMSSNARAAGLERVQCADEDRAALAAGRRAWSAIVDCPIELRGVKGSPSVSVRVRLSGHRYGAGERDVDGAERVGHGVSQATIVDMAAGEELLRESVMEPHAGALAEFERAGDDMGASRMKKALLGKSRADGFLHRRWVELHRPVLEKLIRRETLEQLLARGSCTVVGEIEVDPTPLRTELEAR